MTTTKNVALWMRRQKSWRMALTNIPEGEEDSNEGCSDEDLDSHGSDSSSYDGQGEDIDDDEFALMEEMYG
jgi:hypothetical protein